MFYKSKKKNRHGLLLKISVYLWLVIILCLKVQQKETGTFTGQYKKTTTNQIENYKCPK